jgi:sialate O-acetylesterase
MRDMGGFLWNGMIEPLIPAAFRGVIWYQGESNTSRAEQYRTLFPDMIRAWRAAWGRGDFPFYFVQLANIENRDGWPELREAQRETLSLPNTGMAVTIDIGDPDDVHPRK